MLLPPPSHKTVSRSELGQSDDVAQLVGVFERDKGLGLGAKTEGVVGGEVGLVLDGLHDDL